MLTTNDHRRDAAGLTHIYPVVSRRSGGVSVGVNLNPNNACNWHCCYCQVSNLARGVAPDIDLSLLETELHGFLHELIHGSFMRKHVPEAFHRISDIAISGNGEPTSCRQFDEVVKVIIQQKQTMIPEDDVKLVLITNGSYTHRPEIQQGLTALAANHGETWFKIDRVGKAAMNDVNGVSCSPERLYQQLITTSTRCPTWIQTCMFARNGAPPNDTEITAYLDFMHTLVHDHAPVQGVLLYGLARPSMQAQAEQLSALNAEWMQTLATRIERIGLPVQLSL